MVTKSHILVVEDELTSRATLSGYFENEGYRITEAADGEEMRTAFAKGDVDLVMLDIRLPGEDGLSLLKELRQSSDVGIIMVTGKSDDVDRIVALEMGADDYVTKPFNPRELLARAKNLLKRTSAARMADKNEPVKKFSGWTLDTEKRRLESPEGKDVRLTRGEFELLVAMVNNSGRVLTRDNLLDHISHREWDPNDRTVDVLIGRLRRKIETTPQDPELIATVHGVGYVFTGGRD
ncbi:MAG: two-component system response regulator TorR [Rhodospirillales bacterium]|nr:two-component system response regulator TorR [Rhodospirillales bacterium]MCW8862571.1 two-component system response regulator TorR [Rhodospirillales bacterium]MCW8951620.1 two-component system response regulator TorR [Rhodospirillales bacterium]MCW8970730.1 two-component system response regulator TorR [Rhodospirillales bacterium]MCW9003305.1 two-component system response regulator TorR [Rhodospirillales bacterium]